MTAKLHRRLAALEEVASPNFSVGAIIHRFIDPGTQRQRTEMITCGSLQWFRKDDESEGDFEDRAIHEAGQARPGILLQMFVNPA